MGAKRGSRGGRRGEKRKKDGRNDVLSLSLAMITYLFKGEGRTDKIIPKKFSLNLGISPSFGISSSAF